MAVPKKSGRAASAYVIDARAHIGHVHLKVSNIERRWDFIAASWGLK
jgi:catechol-2,3-dioxygenase